MTSSQTTSPKPSAAPPAPGTGNDPLWRWHELLAALPEASAGGPLSAGVGPDVTGISIDTRTLQPGDLFVALDGQPDPQLAGAAAARNAAGGRDGHQFLAAALRAGAVAALVSDAPAHAAAVANFPLPTIRVPNTHAALWALGRVARDRLQGTVVGLTGSSGKTTLKALLAHALQAVAVDVHASAASNNNHWGVPLTLARTPRGTTVCLVEIGTNHPGEIGRLTALVQPDIAVLLNVLPTHIGHFADLAALTVEKQAIAGGRADAATTQPASDSTSGSSAGALAAGARRPVLVHPVGMVWPQGMAARTPLTFGPAGSDADVCWLAIDHVRAQLTLANTPANTPANTRRTLAITIPGGGAHRAETCAAATAVLSALEVDVSKAAEAFGSLELPAGRGRCHEFGTVTVIDDAYNANPVSMAAALDGLCQTPTDGRRVALLGEMSELGEDTARYHRELAASCRGIDVLIAVGAGIRPLVEALRGQTMDVHWFAADRLSVTAFRRFLQPGDRILVKGSNTVFWSNGWMQTLLAELATSDPPASGS